MAEIEEMSVIYFLKLRVDFTQRFSPLQNVIPAGSCLFNLDGDISINPQRLLDRIIAESVDFYYYSPKVAQNIRRSQFDQFGGIKFVIVIDLTENIGYRFRVYGSGKMSFGRSNFYIADFNIVRRNNSDSHYTFVGDDDGAVDSRQAGVTFLFNSTLFAQFLQQNEVFAVNSNIPFLVNIDRKFQCG